MIELCNWIFLRFVILFKCILNPLNKSIFSKNSNFIKKSIQNHLLLAQQQSSTKTFLWHEKQSQPVTQNQKRKSDNIIIFENFIGFFSIYLWCDRISAIGYCKKQLWLYIWFIEHQHQTISCRLSKKMCRNFFLFIAKCDLNQIDIIWWKAGFFQYVVAEADFVLRCHHEIFLWTQKIYKIF